mmetsp:Transcript_12223/g.8528  ORF Transcript_12223/g.8528 Transcript_12223/m.8528 type:complete len:227 (+) Transcript_12223:549-1229(+)
MDLVTLQKQLTREFGIQSIKQDPVCTSNVQVIYDSDLIKLRDILSKIKQLGYQCSLVNKDDENDIRAILMESVLHYRNKFLVSLALLLPILVLTWVIPYTYSSFLVALPVINGNTLYVLIITILSTVIQFYVGASFYFGACMSLRNKSANMDVLVVLGTTAAWLYGIILIFIGHEIVVSNSDYMILPSNYNQTKMQIHEHVHNFEIASVLITVILLGKYLESFSKK